MRIISKKKLQEAENLMDKKNLDALLFLCYGQFHDSSIEYLTGFRQERRGAFSCLVWTRKKMSLIVSSLDSEQAHEEAEVGEIIEIRKSRFSDSLNESLGKSKIIGINYDVPLWFSKVLKRRKKIDISDDMLRIRGTKEPKEIEIIKKSCSIANHGIRFIENNLQNFDNCKELAIEIEAEMIRKGAEEIPYPTSITTGSRGVRIHPYPASEKKRIGETGLVDFGARYKGYCSDVTVPFFFGSLGERQKIILNTVKEAYAEAISRIETGIETHRLFESVENVIKRSGFEFKHSLGHGIGLDVHEYPNLSPMPQDKKTLRKWMPEKLKENMVFTIEPGIYEKICSFRLENDILLTKKGPEILTKARFLEF